MLAVKIDNPEVEKNLNAYIKSQKKSINEVLNEAIELFLDINIKEQSKYSKKDPFENLHRVDFVDDNEDLSDIELFKHIKDPAKYISDLRKNR